MTTPASPERKITKPSEYKQSSSHKKRKKLLEEKKIVTQNRGYWLKFAEQQQKRREQNTHTAARSDENKKTPSSKVPEKSHCSDSTAKNSCTVVHSENKRVLESSVIPDNTGLILKVKCKEKITLGNQLRLNGKKSE